MFETPQYPVYNAYDGDEDITGKKHFWYIVIAKYILDLLPINSMGIAHRGESSVDDASSDTSRSESDSVDDARDEVFLYESDVSHSNSPQSIQNDADSYYSTNDGNESDSVEYNYGSFHYGGSTEDRGSFLRSVNNESSLEESDDNVYSNRNFNDAHSDSDIDDDEEDNIQFNNAYSSEDSGSDDDDSNIQYNNSYDGSDNNDDDEDDENVPYNNSDSDENSPNIYISEVGEDDSEDEPSPATLARLINEPEYDSSDQDGATQFYNSFHSSPEEEEDDDDSISYQNPIYTGGYDSNEYSSPIEQDPCEEEDSPNVGFDIGYNFRHNHITEDDDSSSELAPDHYDTPSDSSQNYYEEQQLDDMDLDSGDSDDQYY